MRASVGSWFVIGCGSVFLASYANSQPVPRTTPSNGGDFSRVMVDISGAGQNTIIDSPDIDLKRFGIEIVFHRATLGVPPDSDDKGFSDGIRRILARGFLAGAYHVIYPRKDDAHAGGLQADTYFKSLLRTCSSNPGASFITAVDWEPTYRYILKPGQKYKTREPAGMAKPQDVLDFLRVAREKYHVVPIVYTGTDVIGHFKSLNNFTQEFSELRSYPLWISTYQQRFYRSRREETPKNQIFDFSYTKDGRVHIHQLEAHVGYIFPISEDVAPWSDWLFWQHGGGVPGMRDVTAKSMISLKNVQVDMSFFNGARSELNDGLRQSLFTCPAHV